MSIEFLLATDVLIALGAGLIGAWLTWAWMTRDK